MERESIGQREFTFLLCVLAMLVLTGVRLILRLDFIDQQTGFYQVGNGMPLIFGLLYFLCCGVFAFLMFFRQVESELLPSFDRPGGITAALMGAAVLFQAVWDARFWQIESAGPVSDFVLRWVTLALSLAAGAVLLVHAVELWHGKPSHMAASGALSIVILHRSFLLLGGFLRHTAGNAVSEEVLEILLLTLGTLFFVGHIHVLYSPKPGVWAPVSLFCAATYAVTWASLILPTLFGMAISRLAFSPYSLGRNLQASATAFYCLAVLCHTAQSASGKRRAATVRAPYKRRRG